MFRIRACCAKSDKPVEMPFRGQTRVGPRNLGDPDPHGKGRFHENFAWNQIRISVKVDWKLLERLVCSRRCNGDAAMCQITLDTCFTASCRRFQYKAVTDRRLRPGVATWGVTLSTRNFLFAIYRYANIFNTPTAA